MKRILINQDNNSEQFLYEQLYSDLKNQILEGEMEAEERCPSIRGLAETLGISVTTVMQAYNQLLAEGYIFSKPGSGYYVQGGFDGELIPQKGHTESDTVEEERKDEYPYLCDEEVFDFVKWKKCANRVFTEYSKELLYESNIKGELALRKEIAEYLRRSRGVHTKPENIVISAGTQQIAFHLGRILKRDHVNIVAVEKPGYAPVKSMFQDAGFQVVEIPVRKTGIDIGMLPANLKTGVYVNPSNQFPTGVVMPANKRYEILDWAKENHCYIIEDDYNSELRYVGQPLPPIKSLDVYDRVIYLGSFSSTLFSAIKISYMVLTDELTRRFDAMEKTYTQTCSKAEQLTLATFMKEGFYYTTIKKKRTLYTKKLQLAIAAFGKYGGDRITLINKQSGLTLTVNVRLGESEKKGYGQSISEKRNVKKEIGENRDTCAVQELLSNMQKLGIRTYYLENMSGENNVMLSIYYSEIPIQMMEAKIKELCDIFG